jgi:hypothetical protein
MADSVRNEGKDSEHWISIGIISLEFTVKSANSS